jgi:hypothetical protein
VWITLAGSGPFGVDQYVVFDAADGSLNIHALPPLASGPRGLRSLVLGPDGNMWMALALQGALLRVAPDGSFQPFLLLPGDVPVELVATADGLLFTLEHSNRIGFIRALPLPEDKADAKAGAAEPLPAPGPAPRLKLTRDQRRELAIQRDLRAWERQQVRLAEAAAEAGAMETEAEEPESKAAEPEAKAPAATPEQGPDDPQVVLDELNVELSPDDITHILKQHRWRGKPGKGWFAQQHSSRDGIARLLAQSLAACGAIGAITDPDHPDERYTKCRVPQCGQHHSYGEHFPADHFVVVTRPYFDEERGVELHGVVTAYPVHRYW